MSARSSPREASLEPQMNVNEHGPLLSPNRSKNPGWLLLRSVLLSFCLLLPFLLLPPAKAEEALKEASLSANRMRFDSNTGDFLAVGNVVIKADGLTLVSPQGKGNVQRKEVLFEEGVVASGDWRGEHVELSAGSVTLLFGDNPSCKLVGSVKGRVGMLSLDADRFMLKALEDLPGHSPEAVIQLWFAGVRRLEDKARGIVFGAETMEGQLKDGVLLSMKAAGKVWLEGREVSGGEPVNIRGDTALYSEDRGSVVLNGNVRAVQKGRVLTSNSIVYFPDQNRVEAIGGLSKKDGITGTERATITIDLSQEPRKTPKKTKAPPKKDSK
ncbi:MAG: hypothetical protein GX256_02165 [Fretibacterium sp.]|nr:hypothetical protein [Fretibacterium sp.]